MQVDDAVLGHHFSRVSCKRTRSSVSPSPLERPQKRMTFKSYTCHTPEDITMNEDWSTITTAATDEHGKSEDWVIKTSGLRLDSPFLSTYTPANVSLSGEKEWNSPSNTIAFSAHTASFHDNNLAPKLSSNGECEIATTVIDIDVHMNFGVPSLVSTESHMDPPSSGLWHSAPLTTPLPQSPRKLKLKMGRRADCDKCRLNVKGHWMHFD